MAFSSSVMTAGTAGRTRCDSLPRPADQLLCPCGCAIILSGTEKGGLAVQNQKIRLLRAGLLVLAAGLILLGIFSGEVQTVYAKATKICMECIGLG